MRRSSRSCRARHLRLPHHYYPVDENARRDHALRIVFTQLHPIVDLRDRDPAGYGHDGVEIAARGPVREIAPAIAAPGVDQRDVAGERAFEQIVPTFDATDLLAPASRVPTPVAV